METSSSGSGWGSWKRGALFAGLSALVTAAACGGAPSSTGGPDCPRPSNGPVAAPYAPVFSAPSPPALGGSGPAAHLPRVVRQLGHADLIQAVRYSGNGKFLATNSVDRTVKLWDTESGLLLGTSEGYSDQVDSVEILPGDTTAIVGVNSGEVFKLDLASGEKTLLEKNRSSTWITRISPDGRQAIIGTIGHPQLWDLEHWKVIADLDTHGEVTHAAGFTPRGPVVVTHFRKHLVVTNLLTKKVLLDRPTPELLGDIAISRDGSLLVVGGFAPYTIDVYDTTDYRRVVQLPGQRYEIETSALSPDRRVLATAGRDGTMNLWDLAQGRLIHKLDLVVKFKSQDLTGLDFSPDGTKLAIAVGTRRVQNARVVVFDLRQQRIVQEFAGAAQLLASADISSDGSILMTAARSGEVVLWDVNTASRISWLPFADLSGIPGTRGFDLHEVNDAALSKDGRVVAATGGGASFIPPDVTGYTLVRVTDFRSGQSRLLRTASPGRIDDLTLSGDGTRVAVAYWPGIRLNEEYVAVWDVPSGQLLTTVKRSDRNDPEVLSQPIMEIALTHDGGALYTVGDHGFREFDPVHGNVRRALDSTRAWRLALSANDRWAVTSGRGLQVWDLATGGPRPLSGGDGREITAVAISNDGSRVFTASRGAHVDVWDVPRGAFDHRIPFASGTVESLALSTDGRRLVASSRDGTARVVDVAGGGSVNFASGGDEWLMYDDDSYFDASSAGGNLVAIADGLRPYRIDQLAARNNRPDRLLSHLAGTNGEALLHYQGVYRRRLQRLGLDEASLDQGFAAAPRADILALSAAGTRATLDIALDSPAAPLRSYQIYVNKVGVLGASGQPLSGRTARLRVDVELTSGKNRVEVGATNDRGVESLRALRTVEGVGAPPPRLYVLAFGVSHYRNPAFDLKYAHKDALDLVEVARSLEGRGFQQVTARAFVDEEVTVKALRDAKAVLSDARPEDTLIVFVAGHGLYSSDAEASYYYLTHEADPRHLRETAASFDLIEELVSDVIPRRKLLLLDTCASGDRAIDEPASAAAIAGSRGLAPRSSRALVAATSGAGVAAPRAFLFDRNRYIYSDLVRRSGAIVLSSSRGSELSFETDEAQNGLFTEEILRAITTPIADGNHDDLVTDEELRTHVARAVAAATENAQHPVVDTDNPDVDIVLPIARGAAFVLTRGDPLPRGGRPGARALHLETGGPLAAVCPERVPPSRACGCRIAEARPPSAAWLSLSAALLPGFRRRRRRAAA